LTNTWFKWTLPSGKTLGLHGDTLELGGGHQFTEQCETFTVLPFLQDLGPSRDAEHRYAYLLRGVEIDKSALGAPYNVLSTPLHGAMYSFIVPSNFGRLDSVEHCLPVMVKQPVRCVADAHVSLEVDHTMIVSSKDGKCKVVGPKLHHPPPHGPATVLGACTEGHEIGRATILLGAYGLHASALQKLLGNDHVEQQHGLGIQCTVDIAPSIAFRKVVFQPRNAKRFDDSASISALDGTCTPQGSDGIAVTLWSIFTDHALATMAGASWQLLAENYYDDGWPATLYRLADRNSEIFSGKTFNDSTNALEDAIGLASAIAMSSFYGTNQGTAGTWSLEIHGGKASENVRRIGPGVVFSRHTLSFYFLEGLLLGIFVFVGGAPLLEGVTEICRSFKRMRST
jgi:hypothetical protein